MSVGTQRTTRHHIPEDDTLQGKVKLSLYLGSSKMYECLGDFCLS
jgi:hypothetical protein